MTTLDRRDLMDMPSRKRATLINEIGGLKPANLLGTQSRDGIRNLALFNSVVHIGANPPYLGFILRPTSVPRHTYQNILETQCYTINAVTEDLHQRAHQTSGKFSHGESEFDQCGVPFEYRGDFPAPFVGGSPIGLGLRFEEEHLMQCNGTRLVVGSIELLTVPEGSIGPDGHVALDALGLVAIGGLNTYYACKEVGRYDYYRPGESLKPI